MRNLLFSLLSVLASVPGSAQWTFQGDTSATWEQAIARYSELDRMHDGSKLIEIGNDDDGSPLHLFVLSDGSGFTPDSIRVSGKNILWVTNGIHPGEPDGIDASLMLAQALLESDQLMGLLVNTAVCIVPIYNVSGAKNRGSTSRANQNGPMEYGFRGNARNLDLNRDFMKADSRNTRSLITAMTAWDPDVYFETHVSNGADHQYVMELLTTHSDKLDPSLSAFMTEKLVPRLNEWMGNKMIPMCPYFDTIASSPQAGLTCFVDGPRYSSGHAALSHRIGVLSESHMLKPYADRVNATFQLLLATLAVMNEEASALKTARDVAVLRTKEAPSFGFNWTLDTTRHIEIEWKGYEARATKSEVSGGERIRYIHDRPTNGTVPYCHASVPTLLLEKPKAYLIPWAWHEVIDRLTLENVEMQRVETAQWIQAEIQYITAFETLDSPYEGHYLHHSMETRTVRDSLLVAPGDRLVPMGRATDRLVMEILEPRASDSFFAWGFFDSILQQKEWFSDYVFEDIAAELLQHDEELRNAFELERSEDPAFAADGWAQLLFIYQRSPYFEKSYRRYPVVRLLE